MLVLEEINRSDIALTHNGLCSDKLTVGGETKYGSINYGYKRKFIVDFAKNTQDFKIIFQNDYHQFRVQTS